MTKRTMQIDPALMLSLSMDDLPTEVSYPRSIHGIDKFNVTWNDESSRKTMMIDQSKVIEKIDEALDKGLNFTSLYPAPKVPVSPTSSEKVETFFMGFNDIPESFYHSTQYKVDETNFGKIGKVGSTTGMFVASRELVKTLKGLLSDPRYLFRAAYPVRNGISFIEVAKIGEVIPFDQVENFLAENGNHISAVNRVTKDGLIISPIELGARVSAVSIARNEKFGDLLRELLEDNNIKLGKVSTLGDQFMQVRIEKVQDRSAGCLL